MRERVQHLEKDRERIALGGGAGKLEKRRASGRLTARERLGLLFDPGSFTELDAFVRHRATDFGLNHVDAPADGVITGYGTVSGRQVYAYAQDFTVLGGSLGEMHAGKICKAMDLAAKGGVPFIGINDSGGARIQEGVAGLNGYGKIFYRNTLYSGVIPQISAIMGPCAGGAVYSPALTDFVFMVDGTSHMFITGPEVIKTVTGEDVTFEQLGGAVTHNQVSGVAHFIAPSDAAAIEQIKRLLTFLPSNNLEDPPLLPPDDPAARREERLLDVVPTDPNKPYDVRDVILAVVDGGDFLEVQDRWAPNMVVGFARMEGRPVGIIANQPRVLAGCIDINSSDKAARFIRFCDAFALPVITFVDTPGYLPGMAQEHGGIIRHGAKLLYAYSEATVPKLAIILRKAYGGAYLAMCSQSLGSDLSYAWPTAEIAVMGPEGAANIVFKREIEKAEDPLATRKSLIQDYREKFATPFVAASLGLVEGVIDPRDTRETLCRGLRSLAGKRESRPARKHGNFPI
ncbi:MAG: methylmalonyl-CoA carboxyltransferase [Firmicutes bacterium]|nr:methylmalonyl-CoA carboxyltransferase [Bacillota bacterium]